ncbi:SRPBCC domain-containing protein [Proteiniphilum sp. UBA5384]|uniref:SRPBCC domain-containing protein n=1 Tax=Proteiniphilum sp. UBA5384 TaxID=1947279 RepID=UPI0025F96253|nr:SRPBCC domain-containing protein [Proteiniphilum sp. UBA5384]
MTTDFKTQYKTTINAPLEKVWEALTNPAIVEQYFFGTELVTDWEVGKPIVFQGEWDDKKYIDKGEVLEYEHNKKLSYSFLSSWSGKEDLPENYLWVSYEVKSDGENTELTISQSNYNEELAEHSDENWAALVDAMRKIIEK